MKLKLKKEAPVCENRAASRMHMETLVGIAPVSWLSSYFVRTPRFQCSVKDASMSGLSFYASRDVPAGSMVKVWIKVQTDKGIKTLRLLGDVARCDPLEAIQYLVGVRFRESPEYEIKIWHEMMLEEFRFNDRCS